MKSKNYMSIGEFSKLRDIDINSLRYYDRLGILKPAYTDGQSGYRYYAPEQLSQLDIVMLAVSVGMPLKELKKYMHGGSIDAERFMEQGQALLEDKINGLKTLLNNIRHTLGVIRDLRDYENVGGVFTRKIEERRLIVSDVLTELSMDFVEPIGIGLFEEAQSKGMMPVLPSCFLVKLIDGKEYARLCFEIMNFRAEAPNVLSLPAGEYMSVQEEIAPDGSLVNVVRNYFGEGDVTVLVGNMFTSKLTFSEKRLEIQKIT